MADQEVLPENFYSNLLEEIFFDKKNASCKEKTKPVSEEEEESGYSSSAATTGSGTEAGQTQSPSRKRQAKEANNPVKKKGKKLEKDVKCRKKKCRDKNKSQPIVSTGNVSKPIGTTDQLTNPSCIKYEALRIKYEILQHDMVHLRHRFQLEVEKNKLVEKNLEKLENDTEKGRDKKRKKKKKDEEGKEKEEEEEKVKEEEEEDESKKNVIDWNNVRW